MTVSILGVRIANVSRGEAIVHLEDLMCRQDRTYGIYIVNAHTLNLAAENAEYRTLLNAGHRVFADGTGARWAAQLRGVRLKDNLVGTDLIPELFRVTAHRGYRYFLLGATPDTVARAARRCTELYPGWELAGFHHGYTPHKDMHTVIDAIQSVEPHLVLVGMGNPLQEQWIHRYGAGIGRGVLVGVGGLFDHWAGNLRRAPAWVRRNGFEWAQLLLQQPHKWRRYLVGNPKFIARMLHTMPADRRATGRTERS